MPTAPGGKSGRQKQRLTLFGEWIYFLCEYFEVTSPEVEQRANLAHGMLSKNTRSGKQTNTPSLAFVHRLVEAFKQIAHEKQMEWNATFEQGVLHAAGYATEEEREASEHLLRRFQP